MWIGASKVGFERRGWNWVGCREIVNIPDFSGIIPTNSGHCASKQPSEQADASFWTNAHHVRLL